MAFDTTRKVFGWAFVGVAMVVSYGCEPPVHHGCTTGSCVDYTESEEISIPAGDFSMGCNRMIDSECKSFEEPVHSVSLSAYYIDEHEVTASQYQACVMSGACTHPVYPNDGCNVGVVGRERHPANCVSWYQANDYCDWRGKRLPTEAEWEKAAKGDEQRVYPWGNEGASCEFANMFGGASGCGVGSTDTVCSRSPDGDSFYGLCDMAGNVEEWVADWYAPYSSTASLTNPQGPSSGSNKVFRGGGLLNAGVDLRAAARHYTDPESGHFNWGFRCARD